MIEIWEKFSLNHIAIMFAFIALIISVKSYFYTKATNRKIESISFNEKRTELLYEADKLDALFGDQWHMTIDQMMLMKNDKKNPLLVKLAEQLTNIEELRNSNKEVRTVILKIPESDDRKAMEGILSELRSTSIQIQGQIKRQEAEIQKYKLQNV